MKEIDKNLKGPFVELLLSVADDKLMLGHRNSDWTGLAPILEEDIAFSALAQDEIAHAQALYALAAGIRGGTADDLAFGRPVAACRCAAIVELPDEFDWAFALCRQFFCAHFDSLRLERMARSSFEPLAALAGRLAAEERAHVEHADAWMNRLGRGTPESTKRMQSALDRLSAVAPSLLEPVEGQEALESAGIYPPGKTPLLDAWRSALVKACPLGLTLSLRQPPRQEIGGRRGRHTEHLKALLDEMCEVYRLEPGAAW